jgi:hypothetical protein
MMQTWTFEPGIEYSGSMAEAITEAFKLFPSVASKRLLNHGIGTLKGKDVVIDRQAWYPIESWLAAFDGFATSVGPRALLQIGQNVPKYAVLPPGINDIHGAIASVNVGYHMNHRKRGKVMFDPATGQFTPGIGSYGYTPVAGQRKIISVCENPYPCEFDRGILTAFTLRFEKLGRVLHDDTAPCRRNGGSNCTYVITW